MTCRDLPGGRAVWGTGTRAATCSSCWRRLCSPCWWPPRFAVDIGGWYSRGAQIQRAADAAALSGVVWMPDFPTAAAAALATAARNGFVPGGTVIDVVLRSPGSTRR